MSDDKQFFYANSVEAAVTVYDINLKFIRTGTAAAPLNMTSDTVISQSLQPQKIDEFTICMSPQHAKALLPALSKAVAKYEEVFGEIPQQK